MIIPVTATTTAAMALLMVALASRVSYLRMRHKISFGDGGNAELMRAIRLHANTAEHTPVFLLLLLGGELGGGSPVFLGVLGAAFVVARLLFAAGLTLRGLHLLRMAGATVTYLAQAVLAAALLWMLPGWLA